MHCGKVLVLENSPGGQKNHIYIYVFATHTLEIARQKPNKQTDKQTDKQANKGQVKYL